MANTIYYIAKRRELRDAAPERCCLTLRLCKVKANKGFMGHRDELGDNQSVIT